MNDATRDVHESLHVHPLSLALLNRPTPRVVQATMTAAQWFCVTLESARTARGCWKALQLSAQLDALQSDLGTPHSASQRIRLDLDSDAAILGALYVAHGSQFGRQQIRAQLIKGGASTLPAYYAMAVDRPTWQALLDALEITGTSSEGFASLGDGAKAAFKAYRQSLDLATPRAQLTAHNPS
ncbi:MAG: hypothetical protein AAF265_09915 [Pseudomonadota bacterium]